VNDAGQVERLVEALFERLRALRVPALGEDDMLSCSGGYALLRSGEDGRQFLRRADRALYQAKAAGRACVQAAA
jgi:GGDEF domain-containing protein